MRLLLFRKGEALNPRGMQMVFRNKRYIVFRIFLFTALFLVTASCAVSPVTGKRELMLVTEEEEIALGLRAAPSLNWSYGGEYRDPALGKYLEGVVLELWRNSERPHLPVRFVVQNASVPNAFALPGYVAVTRGLLAEMENEAQFAAVMGHEAGHVMARHTAKRITFGMVQQLGLVLGGFALKGQKYGDVMLTAGALGSSLLLLKYDRSQELQSDALGVRYMAGLGYDAGEAIGAHQTLQRAVDKYLQRLGIQRKESTLLDTILSTHPRHEVRVSEMREMIAGLPAYKKRGDGKFAGRFNNALKGLRKANRAYHLYDRAELAYTREELNRAERELKRAIEEAPGQPAFYNLYGMVRVKQKKLPGARTFFRKALSMDRGYQPAVYGLGLVEYLNGNYGAAVRQFEASLKLFPEHPGSIFGAGSGYFRLKKYRKAVPRLKEFASMAPGHPEVHGMLGACYEKTGDREAAVREYAAQVKVAPDNEMGRHARKRLKALAPPGK
jgi:predicted Zn-dependent protease